MMRVLVEITAVIEAQGGFDAAAIEEESVRLLSEHFAGVRPGQTLNPSDFLGVLLEIPGVSAVTSFNWQRAAPSFTALEPPPDLLFQADEVPAAGPMRIAVTVPGL